jgi:hypothetical protein
MLPTASDTMQFQWVAWSSNTFLHNYLTPYIPAHSRVWLCPGWGADDSYDAGRTCSGTPYKPAAGNVVYTPNNLGEGYFYIPYESCFWFSPPQPIPWKTYHIRFNKPKYPDRAKILSCMLAQQAPASGMVGPHQIGKAWNVLWADGSMTYSLGIWGSPPDGAVLVNVAGDWTPKTY